MITALTVAVRPVPEARVYEGWRFESFAAGAAALRRLVQDGPLPTVLRLSDEAETALNLAGPSELGGRRRAAAWRSSATRATPRTWRSPAGGRAGVLRGGGRRTRAGRRRALGARPLPRARTCATRCSTPARSSRRSRRSTFWSALPRLYGGVSAALRESLTAQGTPPLVLCHISHVYPSGASLYFTVGCAQLADPVAQWRAAKAAASDAILAAGGSITHHHGVGTDHVTWYREELGELGVDALRAVKRDSTPTAS